MPPILHLSIPVLELEAAKAFYVGVLGCDLGREREDWADVWFFGLQLTLQERPDEVTPDQGCRHFGATLGEPELHELVARAEAAGVEWVHRLSTDFAGMPQSQTKAKLRDPSGNVIELKAYADPAAAFEVGAP